MSDRAIRKRAVQRPNKTILSRTLFLLMMCGVAAFAVLAVRLYNIQIAEHDYYENLALNQQMREATITASRGTIFDANGKRLAISASVENVFISPVEIGVYEEDVQLIADGLSAILGVDRESIIEKSKDVKSEYKTIKLQVESEEATLVREFKNTHKLKSIHLEPATKRYYPLSSLACQVIGFVGTENKGLEGIEARYDSYLTGVNGRVKRLKNAKGTELMFSDYEDYYDAQNGNDITLTIDANIQYYVDKHLSQAIEDYNVENGGSCIVMEADTAAILAMSSFSNYDLNNYQQLNEKELEKIALIEDEEEREKARNEALFRQLRNKALADTYEPGSVSKILTLAMALEENVVSTQDTFYCGGQMEVLGRRPLNCWRTYGHASQTLNQAMQNSCNVALVTIGLRVGAQTFYKYMEAFGLFEKTGFDNNAEGKSQWWSEEVFFDEKNKSQLASASFGQTFKVTPLQMITAVAASVNGGRLMQPYVVEKITDGEGNIIEATEPTMVRQVISSETSAIVREILEDVVKTGTGKNAQVKGYRVGGKTGTSENIEKMPADVDDGEKDYIVSFCGFAPADDPEIVILLLLDTPRSVNGTTISGGAMAAPVVGNMFADILPYIGVVPQYTEEEMKDLNVTVPKLVKKSVEESKAALTKQGFEYTIVGTGDTVTAQLPAQNALVSSGTRVIIYAGEDPPKVTTVPSLYDKSYPEAKAALEESGLFIRTTGAAKSDEKATVTVQSIPGETETNYGAIVEVTLIDKTSVELPQ